MKIERTKNAARNLLFGTILKVLQTIVPFLMRTAMIYYMGVKYLGLDSLFSSVLQVLNVAELGVGSAMVYSMYKPIAVDDKATICALMRLYRLYYRIIGGVIAVLGIVLLPFIPNLVKGDIPSDLNISVLYLLNLGATVVSYWLFAYKNSILTAHQRNDIASKVTIATDMIKYLTQFAVIYFTRSYYAYLVVRLITQILTNIITAIVATKMYPEYSPMGELPKSMVKNINGRVRDLFTAKVGGTVTNAADSIVISAFLGLTELAVYQNYYYILQAVRAFIAIIYSAVSAGIGNSLITESKEKNYMDLKKFTFIICWLLNICCCCFLCLFQPFMELWVGRELMLSFACVVLLCIYFYTYDLIMVWATIKDAAGMWHEDRFRPLIGSTTNLCLNLILVQRIGIYGVILSTVLSQLCVSMPWLLHNIFSVLYDRKKGEYLLYLIKAASATIIACIISYILCGIFSINGIMELIINMVICLLVSNTVQFLFFRKDQELLDSFMIVKRMLNLR